MTQGQRREKHLNANDKVLVTSGDRPLTDGHLLWVYLWDGPALLQDGQQHAWSQMMTDGAEQKSNSLLRTHANKKARRSFRTLPEGEEDDRLDHEELEHRAVRAEQLPGGEVKEEEGVEGQANRDVVDDGHVQVTAGNTVEREDRQKDVRGAI